MDPSLATLLATNEAPSDEVMASARSYLAKAQLEFAGIDADVQRCEHALREAKSHRNRVQDRIQLYQAVLSPIRRLPDDVLREIFLFTLSTTRNPIINAGEAPLLLTHICSSWRAVALSSPRIWARLHISFPGNELSEHYRLPDMKPTPHNVAEYDEAMARRRAVVEEWLSRSGGCPLSLSIWYPISKFTDDEFDKPAQDLLQTLLSHMGRWKVLELTAPIAVYSRIQAGFSIPWASPSPLEVLRIRLYHVTTNWPTAHLDLARSIPLLTVPKLRHLEVDAKYIGLFPLHTLRLPGQQWDNISNLVFHSPVQDCDVLDIFKLMPNLVHCKLRVHENLDFSSNFSNAGLGPRSSDKSSKSVVKLPRLETLSIYDNGSPTTMDNSLGVIEAPLKRLEYYRDAIFRVQAGQMVVHETRPCAFTPLLEICAATLQALAWSPPGTTDPIACLQTPGRLRHLIMGRKPLQKGVWGESFDYTPIFASLASLESAGTKLERESSVLLPYLQDLEVYQVGNVSDELILHVIRSRLRRYSQGLRASKEAKSETAPSAIMTKVLSDYPPLVNGIAALRKVVIIFERSMQVDIKPEVERLAMEAGIPFHLELSYVPYPLPRHNPLSTSYGLSDEGTTW